MWTFTAAYPIPDLASRRAERQHLRVARHPERDAAVIGLERVRLEMRVGLFGDRDRAVTEDPRKLEDVAAVDQKQGRERVAHVVDAQRVGELGAIDRSLER